VLYVLCRGGRDTGRGGGSESEREGIKKRGGGKRAAGRRRGVGQSSLGRERARFVTSSPYFYPSQFFI
jgi:hypothetical protein